MSFGCIQMRWASHRKSIRKKRGGGGGGGGNRKRSMNDMERDGM